MLHFLFLLASLVSEVFSQEFNGQVNQVYTNIDMVHTELILSYQAPGLFVPFYLGYNTTITPTGTFIVPANSGAALLGLQRFSFETDKEFHFQFQASYHSEGLPDGPSGDPAKGSLTMGLFFDQNAGVDAGFITWMITDYTEYAFIQADSKTYAIPIGTRTPDELATYAIIVDKSSLKVRFNKNNVNLLIAPGTCGIDDRFRIDFQGKTAETSSPLFAGQFEQEAQLLILIGNFFRGPTPYCTGCVFDQCHDSLSHAFGCQCQYIQPQFVPSSVIYHVQMDGIQAFDMMRTQRCQDEESSSTTFRQWWRNPFLKDDQEPIVEE